MSISDEKKFMAVRDFLMHSAKDENLKVLLKNWRARGSSYSSPPPPDFGFKGIGTGYYNAFEKPFIEMIMGLRTHRSRRITWDQTKFVDRHQEETSRTFRKALENFLSRQIITDYAFENDHNNRKVFADGTHLQAIISSAWHAKTAYFHHLFYPSHINQILISEKKVGRTSEGYQIFEIKHAWIEYKPVLGNLRVKSQESYMGWMPNTNITGFGKTYISARKALQENVVLETAKKLGEF